MTKESKPKKLNTSTMVVLAILIAMNVVLSRFVSINAWNIKIGFTFASTFIAAYLYGPIAGIAVGGLGDLLGAILFPIGPYFPGFTLNCALTGLVMGLLLHQKGGFGRIAITVAIDQLFIATFVTSLWISILYKSPYWPIVLSRLPQVGIMIVIEFFGIYALIKLLNNPGIKKLVRIK